MRVLVLNSGSSSLKFRILDFTPPGGDGRWDHWETAIAGAVAGIGGQATLHLSEPGAAGSKSDRVVMNHEQAVQWMFERLGNGQVEAVGHRVVHGGGPVSSVGSD